MSSKDSVPSVRQCSVESGLTQVIPALLCIPEKDIKAPKTGTDHLSVPHTASSKMAKMKKKIHSPLSKRKGSSSESSESAATSSKVFGVSLKEAVKQDEGPPIPWVVVRIVEYLTKNGLKNEGIFRVNGNKKNAEMMKAAFDRDYDADLEEIGDVMAVAGLLKQYLRDLPEPPIPQSLTQEFIRIHTNYGDDDNSQCINELKDLLGRLPMLNYQLVKYLCAFLVKVSKYEENNKMSAMALAIVFGPNFFRCKDGLEGLKEQGHTNAIVCKFLQEYDKLFPDDDEVSPYATTDIFNITTPSSPDSIDTAGPSYPKVHENSASDEEITASNKANVEITVGKPEPVYAYIDRHKKQLNPSASSSSEELDLYVRSVSPSLWNSNGNTSSNSSQSTAHPQHHGPPGRDFVQNAIKDSIKEHLFGPDIVSTDENDCSPNESEPSREHSAESLEASGPPLPARNYGPEDTNRPRAKRRRNAKKQKEPEDEGRCEGDITPQTSEHKPPSITNNMPAVEKEELVITLDQNSNSIVELKSQDDKSTRQLDSDGMDEGDEDLSEIRRNSGILKPLTKHRAPPPSNRRSPSLNPNKRNSQSDLDEEDEIDEYGDHELPKTFVHPLVEEAKSRGKISTPPPRSPRSSPRVSKSPPSPLSPNKHATVDEVDGGYNPVKELMTRQHKKRGRGVSAVPPLELYKLQQGDSDDLIKYDVQLSPRERYDGFGTDEALLSPRSRPLSIDTKSFYSTECPPSPPHDHIEPFWSDRRMESPKGELSVKHISRNIHQLKKKIREFEEEFEAEHGHKPSQSEKAPVKKYLSDLTRYRKELKEMKEKAKEDSERLIETVPSSTKQEVLNTNSTAEPLLTTTPATVQLSLDSILRKLQNKRKAQGRSEDIQSMTLEELQDEKLCVQKVLLQHESVFGRPSTKKDKDIMRPLYDRYRLIKRKLNASRTQSSTEDLSSKAGEQNTWSDREGLDMGSEEQLFGTLTKDLSKAQKRYSDISTISTDNLDNCSDFGGSQENLLEDKERDAKLHHMSPDELQKQSELAKREKKRLRKKLKKFEDDFLERTGRRVQRDERGEMENDYREYKEIKARLRLIDVLLTKRQSSQTI